MAQTKGKADEILSVRIPAIGSLMYRGISLTKDQSFINGFFDVTQNPETQKSNYYFTKRQGIVQNIRPPSGAATGRGFHYWNGKFYSVFGNKIYGNITDLGVTMPGSSGLVTFCETRPGAVTQYLGINDKTNLYLIDTSDNVIVLNNKPITSSSVANPTVITATAHGLATGNRVYIVGHTGSTPSINGTVYTVTVTSANTFTIPVNVTVGGTGGTIGRFPTPNTGDLSYMDGYWLTLKSEGSVWSCDLDDPKIWDPTKFLVAQMYNGVGVGLARQSNLLFIFSDRHVQAFYNNANVTGLPLSNYEQVAQQVGCIARNSIVERQNTTTWVSNTGKGGFGVYSMEGLTGLNEISTPAIQKLLNAEVSNISNCYAYNFAMSGRYFYALNLTGANRTLIYDYDNKLWTEFQEAGSTNKWPMVACSQSSGAPFFQDAANGYIYSSGPNIHDDAQVNFTFLMRLGRVDFDTMQRKFIRGLEIVGDRQSTETLVSLQYSDDDWVSLSTARPLDMALTRVYADRLGSFRRRSFQVSYTGANPCRIEALELKIKVGDK